MNPVGNAQVDQGERAAVARCSATRPTSARCRRAGQTFHMDFDHYEEVPQSIASEIVEQGGGGS